MTTIDLSGFSGQKLVELLIECSVVMNFEGEYGVLLICPFTLETRGATHHIAPATDPPEAFVPVRNLLGTSISTSNIGENGSLSLTFDDGSILHVEPDPNYEAWNLSGPDGLVVVCMAGGELAIWSGIAPMGDG